MSRVTEFVVRVTEIDDTEADISVSTTDKSTIRTPILRLAGEALIAAADKLEAGEVERVTDEEVLAKRDKRCD